MDNDVTSLDSNDDKDMFVERNRNRNQNVIFY